MAFRPTQIAIHHSVTAEDADPLNINRLHKARGFSGIGYHSVVYRAAGGDVVLGDGRDDQNIGAHTRGANSRTIGVVVAGDFSHHEPDAEQYGVLVGQCIAWCRKYNIPASAIHGHRDTPGNQTATVCPGRIDIARVRRMVAAALRAWSHRMNIRRIRRRLLRWVRPLVLKRVAEMAASTGALLEDEDAVDRLTQRIRDEIDPRVGGETLPDAVPTAIRDAWERVTDEALDALLDATVAIALDEVHRAEAAARANARHRAGPDA